MPARSRPPAAAGPATLRPAPWIERWTRRPRPGRTSRHAREETAPWSVAGSDHPASPSGTCAHKRYRRLFHGVSCPGGRLTAILLRVQRCSSCPITVLASQCPQLRAASCPTTVSCTLVCRAARPGRRHPVAPVRPEAEVRRRSGAGVPVTNPIQTFLDLLRSSPSSTRRAR